MINLLKFQVLTEKSLICLENNKYVFNVDTRLNKRQIKKIIEKLFKIKVYNVKTCRIAKKVSNLSKNYNRFYKKAIVTIDSNDIITFR